MASRVLKRRNGTKHKRPHLPWVIAFFVLVGTCFIGALGLYALGNTWLEDLPDYKDSSVYNLAKKTRVYASDGTTLLAEFYLENREPVNSLSDISPYVLKGVIATEDQRFYQHNGVDPMGIVRSALNNVLGGSTEGASTITQQFVRGTVLSGEATEKTLKRKVREAYIALKLEETFSKDEILLMYLNTVNFGSGAYGIEAAAQKYFSCSAKDLTLAQAALLAGIPQSPTYNNPINYPDNALNRRNTVLNRMLSNNYITQQEYDEAVSQPLGLNVAPKKNADGIYAYPYFTSYVRETLLKQYSTAEVFKGGMTVVTTLDIKAQEAAEQACQESENGIPNDLEYALVAVDPETGYIRALVGGRDYYQDEYNLATQALRQTGSSFKTYTLLTAIENGIDPNTTYVDCSGHATIGTWNVENFAGTDYGTRTIASAFAVSSNTGFARLCTLVGPNNVAEEAKKCGITTPLESVPSITLGVNGVTVREMAGAYATIASGGIQREAVPIERITGSNGQVIFQADTTGTRVFSEQVAYAAEQVMEGVINGGTGGSARLRSQTAAGKTGTTQNYRDSYFCGITPQYSVAVWLGSRQEREMPGYLDCTGVFSNFLNRIIPAGTNKPFVMANAGNPQYRKLTAEDMKILGATGAPKEETSSSSKSSGSTSSSTSSSKSSSQSTSSSETSSTTENTDD